VESVFGHVKQNLGFRRLPSSRQRKRAHRARACGSCPQPKKTSDGGSSLEGTKEHKSTQKSGEPHQTVLPILCFKVLLGQPQKRTTATSGSPFIALIKFCLYAAKVEEKQSFHHVDFAIKYFDYD
jgi:hypothetical protein